MISNRMYKLLSALPRDESFVSYQDLIRKAELPKYEIGVCLQGHQFLKARGHTLIETYRPNVSWEQNSFTLSDEGLAELELYEQQMRNQQCTEETLRFSKFMLGVSLITLIVAVIDCFKH